jgi:hypothetical protein
MHTIGMCRGSKPTCTQLHLSRDIPPLRLFAGPKPQFRSRSTWVLLKPPPVSRTASENVCLTRFRGAVQEVPTGLVHDIVLLPWHSHTFQLVIASHVLNGNTWSASAPNTVVSPFVKGDPKIQLVYCLARFPAGNNILVPNINSGVTIFDCENLPK